MKKDLPAWVLVCRDYIQEHWQPADETDKAAWFMCGNGCGAFDQDVKSVLPYWISGSFPRFSAKLMEIIQQFMPADLYGETAWIRGWRTTDECTLRNWEP